MLELKDFYVLPELDALMGQLIAANSGLVLVAGLDARPLAPGESGGFLPSGRSTIFRILMRQMMEPLKRKRVMVVAERRDAVRLPRGWKRRVRVHLVRAPQTYAGVIERILYDNPWLLVVDQLNDVATAQAALDAARKGVWVLSQMDTVFRGEAVARALQDLGVSEEYLPYLQWVVGVRRLPTLCPQCKEEASITDTQLALIRQRYPHLDLHNDITFYTAHGCRQCEQSGRHGDVTAFDIFQAAPPGNQQKNLLPLETYLFRLVGEGHLPLQDLIELETDELRRTYHLLTNSEQALRQANESLQQKLAELEAAHQVLQHRTEALISLQEISQALITVGDLRDLAHRVCRHTAELCGGDRAVLYLLRDTEKAEVLASYGWEPSRVPQTVAASILDLPASAPPSGSEALPFDGWPPGIKPRAPDVEGVYLYAGLHVPLVAQNEIVGLLVVHATQKKRFAPGDVALLRSFANQAALALQRAGLIEQLRAKIEALEAAHQGLAQKERLERELELAREVQQSVLPREVPRIPGFRFAMHNEPARQVGGDFYDVVLLDEDTFAIIIADVSDKGMPAALYMALSRSLILCEARLMRTPYNVLCSVNELLLELAEPNMFVTVFYGLIERRTGRMTYVRAGHDWPLLLRGDTVQELHGQGMVLGLLPTEAMQMQEETVMLERGDRLVLYTDGLTDALSPTDERYDRDRFVEVLQKHAALPADELCQATFAALHAFRGRAAQHDDMTMLVVDVEMAHGES